MSGAWVVRYAGFLGPVVRRFDSQERAVQWARQVGVERRAVITEGKA